MTANQNELCSSNISGQKVEDKRENIKGLKVNEKNSRPQPRERQQDHNGDHRC